MPVPGPVRRGLILVAYNGGITGVYTDDGPVDIVIATVRKDGHITGRPITALATHYPALVEYAFQLAEGRVEGEQPGLTQGGPRSPQEGEADQEGKDPQ